MALHIPKTTLLHAALATISPELATIDDIIRSPARLPTELMLVIRAHLLTLLTHQNFLQSTHALTEYERDLQRLLCPDCISYNIDIYGPDVWQWQQFSGPCNCVRASHGDPPEPSTYLPHFITPHHWLEYYLSIQAASATRASPSPSSIWDVVTNVLRLHHCEPLQDDINNIPVFPPSLPRSSFNIFYHHRVANYYGSCKQSQSRPAIHIRPLRSSLRLLESRGIGEVGDAGDAFRADIILRHAVQELGLAIELKDIFDSPREPLTLTFSLLSHKHDTSSGLPIHNPAHLCFSTLPFFSGLMQTYSFLSTVFQTFISMPMAVATLALAVICFYSRPIALRVGI
ncbi:hypothetical protein Agabi119p4_347 [Agaricus bisporus var. burnettii]|uniref:Uncharacterized protein n=1 Tax=Agaricus bisporus var. burnettii TaxID=192524 RepID=A0A8H7KKZ8_AGABI|nr:hypothetical protein Agabi119p4_347 [Agaricus bisporus var. burnettii]